MAKNTYGNDQGIPSWQSGDTTTFANQSKNLAEQAGDAGLNTGEIQVQQQTADAMKKAGESGQNVAAGTEEVAKGAEVTPDVAQANTPAPISVNGGASTQIKPYEVTKEAPVAPDTTITNPTDFTGMDQYKDPTTDYLSTLFPQGIPQSVLDSLDKSVGYKSEGHQETNPAWTEWAKTHKQSGGEQSDGSEPDKFINVTPKSVDTGLVNSFNDYLNNLQSNINNKSGSPEDVQQYQNYLQNQLAKQQQDIDQKFNKGEIDIAQQKTDKSKALSDYINQLQTGLSDYQKRTQDLSNVGALSESERNSAAQNAILADQNSGSKALSALSATGLTNSRLGNLSQQAESAAIQKARGQASAAQEQAKTGAEIQAEGQKAQANAYKEGGNTITKNQTDSLKKLADTGNDAQKQLADAYNNSKTNLNKNEQDYVSKAQDTLRNSKIDPQTIKYATNAFANTVKSYVDKGNLTDDQKYNLRNQMESIWRIAVGANKGDINYSNQIAGILMPIVQSLGESSDFKI